MLYVYFIHRFLINYLTIVILFWDIYLLIQKVNNLYRSCIYIYICNPLFALCYLMTSEDI